MHKAPLKALTRLWDSIEWTNALFFYGTALGALVLVSHYLWNYGWNPVLFLLFFWGVVVSNLSITVGYHRLLAHKSHKAQAWLKYVLLTIAAGAFQGSALWWASRHRDHHQFVDTDRDPHNIERGFYYAHMGWLFDKQRAIANLDYGPDLLKDPAVMWQHRNLRWLSIAVGFVFPLLIGIALGMPWGGLVFGGLLRVVVSNHTTFLINSAAHTWGRRTYDSSSTARDNALMAILAFGEGHHNFHHAFAADYRNGVRWFDWDPTKWLIRSFAMFGWCWDLKRTSRAEILRLRLQNEQKQLVARGLPEEWVSALRERIERAQRRWKECQEDYRKLRADWGSRSSERLATLRRDIHAAQLEFEACWRQWQASLGGRQTGFA